MIGEEKRNVGKGGKRGKARKSGMVILIRKGNGT